MVRCFRILLEAEAEHVGLLETRLLFQLGQIWSGPARVVVEVPAEVFLGVGLKIADLIVFALVEYFVSQQLGALVRKRLAGRKEILKA